VLIGSLRGTHTTQDGSFTFQNLSAGTYTLRVSFVGFEAITQKIVLDKDQQYSFVLKRSVFMADEVVVSATRANQNSAMAYSSVSQEELQKQNLGQDLPYLLALSPSLVNTSDAGAGVGYTGIRIRGTDATRINVTLNGIPYNDSESQGTFWVNMPDFASSVSSVQIQRGVGTSTNGGSAFGATVNMQTNEFRPEAYAELNNAYGSFNTLKNTVRVGSGLLNGKFTVDGRLSRIVSEGYIDRASSDLRSFYLSGAYFGEKSFVRLNVFSGKERTYQAWGGVPESLLKTNRTFNVYTYPNQTDNYQQDHYQLLSSHTLSDNLSFNLNFHYTAGAGYYEQYLVDESFTAYAQPAELKIGNEVITKTDLIRRRWLDNDFYGTTFSFDYQDFKKTKITLGGAWNKYVGNHFGEIIWAKYAINLPSGYRWYENAGTKTDFNAFAKVNYQVSEIINAFADVQLRTVGYGINGIDNNLRKLAVRDDLSFWNPKVGLTARFNEKISAFASLSVGNKEPNRDDYVDALANTKAQSEKLTDYETGLRFQSKNVAFAITAYYMNYSNQLVLTGKVNDVGNPIRQNVTSSYRRGIELEWGYQIAKNLRWNANATFSQNKIDNFVETVPNYDTGIDRINNFEQSDISFSPSLIAGSTLAYTPTSGLEMSILSKYVGKQYLDNTMNNARSLNAYFTNDFRINYSFKTKAIKEVGLVFLLNNMFGTLYENNGYTYSYIADGQTITENFYYPQAPQNFMIGLNLKF
jgi:iron complex outermembrane recepter protein